MGTAEENNDNAPVAFVLVTAAGLATCIGAALVFDRRMVSVQCAFCVDCHTAIRATVAVVLIAARVATLMLVHHVLTKQLRWWNLVASVKMLLTVMECTHPISCCPSN